MTSNGDDPSRHGTRRAYRVAYDGREYTGFQRQPHAKTVEGTLLRALAKHGILDRGDGPTHATPPGYAAAGRTDAGVSAAAQTIAFDAPDWLTPRAFNGRLPGSIRVWAATDVPDAFHARHEAASRRYRYFLYARSAADLDHGTGDGVADHGTGDGVADHGTCEVVDDERIHDALDRLSGAHDFRNFTSDDRGTERDVNASATRLDRELLVVDVTAGGFPRAFVRRLVGAVRSVGSGRAEPEYLDRLLDPEPVDGGGGVGPAPPEPLVLWDVVYDEIRFEVDAEAATSARVVFGERYRDARRMTAMTAAIRDRFDGGE